MIFFFYGSDSFRAKQKIRALKDKFIRDVDPSGNGIIVLDGAKISIDKISLSFGAKSLFVRRNLIIVENIFKREEKDFFIKLLDLLKQQKDNTKDNIFVFYDEKLDKNPFKAKKDLWDFLKKQDFAQEFKVFSNTETGAWIKKEFEKQGARISLANALFLASLINNDLWRANKEINKLINYKRGQINTLLKQETNIEINKDDIEQMVQGEFDESIFRLTDALSTKNKALALTLLEEQIIGGTNYDYLVTMMLWQFKNLLRIKEALDDGKNAKSIASTLKMHPYVVQKNISQLRNFSIDKLKNILNEIYRLERKTKNKQKEFKIHFNLLISKI